MSVFSIFLCQNQDVEELDVKKKKKKKKEFKIKEDT